MRDARDSLADKLVNAVLYEGHILYPYRPGSRKNRTRFTKRVGDVRGAGDVSHNRA